MFFSLQAFSSKQFEGNNGYRLRPEDVAEVIAFTTALPRHVNLQQVTVMPTRMGQ